LLSENEWPLGALKLPWKEEKTSFVGEFAKKQGARVPTRLVQSAKSWLCNVAANRRDKILPLEAADTQHRLSPVEASAKYLAHLKEAWNYQMAKGDPSAEFEEQEIILTVPASFDEVARSLTVEAARQAGFVNLTLLEEPQAAFYSWISMHEKSWEEELKAGDSILVCDVGGGTTDFSLIEVHQREGQLSFQRMAVGDHLLLGGDNIDAALAHDLEKKINKQGTDTLDPTQWLQLVAEARAAKEALLKEEAQEHDSYSVVLQGTGSSVVRGSLTVSIQKREVEDLLLKGFFGQYELEEALQLRKSRGFRTMGLPYEDEPSITKHMAHFLQQAGYVKEKKGPNFILFNGGTMKPSLFQRAIFESLRRWFPDQVPYVLPSVSLDLAVSRGAAYYGKVRRGLGIAIKGGLPRTYYLAVDVKKSSGETERKALTLLTRGAEEGASFQPEQIFSLLPNTPVSFHVLTSHVRLHDHPGDLAAIDEQEMQLLPPIHTILRFGRKQGEEGKIPVRLGICLTPIGTLELWLESQKTNHKWNLEFQLRSAVGQEHDLAAPSERKTDETFDVSYLQEAERAIEELFLGRSKPGQIMDQLEELLSATRQTWPPSVLRGLSECLFKQIPNRKKSIALEARWWNLAGFFLRPGFGYPLDDFRIKELWKVILGDLKSPHKAIECQIQQWICFRRIAGGLNKGQQMQIASELVSTVIGKKSGKIEVKGKGELYAYSEKIRALAAMERLEMPLKIRLGEAVLQRILQEEGMPFDYWSLARIGARHLVYGSVGQVVPRDVCTKWIEQLMASHKCDQGQLLFVLGQLARKTDQRELNISDSLVQTILNRYDNEHLHTILLNPRSLTQNEQEQVFGDHLPPGLTLES
jgi:molecular chaperone DnaK (HSP70)